MSSIILWYRIGKVTKTFSHTEKSKKKDKLPLCLCFLSFLRMYATRGNLLFGFALIV